MRFAAIFLVFAFGSMGLADNAAILTQLSPKIEKLASEFKSGDKAYCATSADLYQSMGESAQKAGVDGVALFDYVMSHVSDYGLTEENVAQISTSCGFFDGE